MFSWLKEQAISHFLHPLQREYSRDTHIGLMFSDDFSAKLTPMFEFHCDEYKKGHFTLALVILMPSLKSRYLPFSQNYGKTILRLGEQKKLNFVIFSPKIVNK